MIVCIGYSEKSFSELVRYFLSGVNLGGPSEFQMDFGGGIIEEHEYEVYDRETYGDSFDATGARSLFPFDVSEDDLNNIDFARAKTIFYIESDANIVSSSGVFIVNKLKIDTLKDGQEV